jgi:proteasome alpha subunit
MDLEGGLSLALRALASVSEEGLDASGVDVATVDVESEQFTTLSEDDVAERVTELELGGESDE